ncbi:hypothetical protein ACPB9J_06390 [Streptomyces lavendulocolor]|uniref:hypothetical protein n=1 Tax=Streptomyces lavendulocolor TaxID=67316 RepID=UPI003C2F862F
MPAGALAATGRPGVVAPAATATERHGGAAHCVTVPNGVDHGAQESAARSRACLTGQAAGDRAERAVPSAATGGVRTRVRTTASKAPVTAKVGAASAA